MKTKLTIIFLVLVGAIGLMSSNVNQSICKQALYMPQYVPDVTYKITEREDHHGYENITFYNLEVTNNTDRNIYVFGTVHIISSSDRETRHYKGIVAAHSHKSVFETIDEPFYVVKMEYQDDL